MKKLSGLMLAFLLFSHPRLATAATAQEQVRASIDRIFEILNDSQLKREPQLRRKKLKDAINERFDFFEMAKRSMGPDWRRLTPEQQKEFVTLFKALLEDAYLERIEAYHGEKVRYVKDRQDGDYAEVDTKLVDAKTDQEVSLDYRLHDVNGDWKVYDVVIDDVSLVNNYRAQFARVLAKSSVDELLRRMQGKQFSSPTAKS
jgi:phospholipid transport system substrate-binding protein